jgi:hypothetical protein
MHFVCEEEINTDQILAGILKVTIENDTGSYLVCTLYTFEAPVTVAELSKACTVFASSEAGIVDSNPTQGMDV